MSNERNTRSMTYKLPQSKSKDGQSTSFPSSPQESEAPYLRCPYNNHKDYKPPPHTHTRIKNINQKKPHGIFNPKKTQSPALNEDIGYSKKKHIA